MRFTLVASLVGVLAGYAAGGRLRNLRWARFRALPLLLAGLVGHVVLAASVPPGAFAVLLTASICLAAFAVANVVTFPGMWLVGVGLLANLVVVGVNHGMPYRPSALDAAGIERAATADALPRTVSHHPEGPDDRLVFLGEVLALAPLRDVVSLGDIAVGAGAACVVANALGRTRRRDRPRHARRRPSVPAEPPSSPAVDLAAEEAVLDLTSAAPGEDLATAGDEFWATRAAVMGEHGEVIDPETLLPEADERPDEPGEVFWRARESLEAKGTLG